MYDVVAHISKPVANYLAGLFQAQVGPFVWLEWRLVLEPMSQESEIILGEREEWGGGPRPFGISASDRRHHVYVIGTNRIRKTTLLRNMLLQDMNLGHCVGVIDAHGGLAQDLLSQVPPWRSHPLGFEFPVLHESLGESSAA